VIQFTLIGRFVLQFFTASLTAMKSDLNLRLFVYYTNKYMCRQEYEVKLRIRSSQHFDALLMQGNKGFVLLHNEATDRPSPIVVLSKAYSGWDGEDVFGTFDHKLINYVLQATTTTQRVTSDLSQMKRLRRFAI
jgi:hypothetical protein